MLLSKRVCVKYLNLMDFGFKIFVFKFYDFPFCLETLKGKIIDIHSLKASQT